MYYWKLKIIMGTWRCGTCHQLLLRDSDVEWHRQFLKHEPPYDDEAGEEEMLDLLSSRGEEE